jgi:hypothetical protein
MLAGTLVIALLVSLAAVAWVVWPLLNRAPALPLVEDDRLSTLIARKEAVMTAIKDLEFDYRVGKLDQEDYARYDQRLRRQAIGLIQQIETVAPQSTGLDVKLESEIMHRRKVAAPALAGAPVAAAPQPAPIAQPVGARPQPSNGGVAVAVGQPVAVAATLTPAATSAGARFCTNCGARLELQHKFCANCGTPVGV